MKKIILLSALSFIGFLQSMQELEKSLNALTTQFITLEENLKKQGQVEIHSEQEFETLLKKATEAAQQQQKSFEEVVQFLRNINEQEQPIMVRNAIIDIANRSADVTRTLDILNGRMANTNKVIKQKFNNKIDALHTMIKNAWNRYAEEFDTFSTDSEEKPFFNRSFDDQKSPEKDLKEVISIINTSIQERNISFNPEIKHLYEMLQNAANQLATLKISKNNLENYINTLENKKIDGNIFSELNQKSIVLRKKIEALNVYIDGLKKLEINELSTIRIKAFIKQVHTLFEEISQFMVKKLEAHKDKKDWNENFLYQLGFQPHKSSVAQLLSGIKAYVDLHIPN